jgi:ribonucleoside-diphosphate reductase alpha chain
MSRKCPAAVRLPTLGRAARAVWRGKYASPGECAPTATMQRVATAVASSEHAPECWRSSFASLLSDYRFIPGGRILAGAGRRGACLSSCFVSGALDARLTTFRQRMDEARLTLMAGGGLGIDLTPLPASCGRDGDAPCASDALQTLERLCAGAARDGSRRGAMMAVLACDHPDIEAFINAKRRPGTLSHITLSVAVDDDFLAARRHGRARATWRAIAQAAHACAEPGILFIDRINRANSLPSLGAIHAANPCGEAPMTPYGACTLGSLNLVRFIHDPFGAGARVDAAALRAATRLAVRFLDDVVDASAYPLAAQAAQAQATRRIGLGVTGLADALIMLNLRYDTAQARAAAAAILRLICTTAYRASIALAREKGAFHALEAGDFVTTGFAQFLPLDIRRSILKHGLRNASLLAIAPAGSISLLAGNVSSGIEPVAGARVRRRLLQDDFTLDCWSLQLWRTFYANARPPAFATLEDITPEAQIEMTARLQRHVDGAISKTVSAPPTSTRDDVERLLEHAASAPLLKGFAFFRRDAARCGVIE